MLFENLEKKLASSVHAVSMLENEGISDADALNLQGHSIIEEGRD